jgi:type IV secretory pathway VirJ component
MGTAPRRAAFVLFALMLALAAAPAAAKPAQSLRFPLRGKVLTLQVYRPAEPPKGTVVMASGDVGWVGLAVSMAEFLSDQGYVVIGVNTRQYLTAFTDGKQHMETQHPPVDYSALRDFLDEQHLLHRPVVLSGVSEGAALAVLAASLEANHRWVDGVITMGTPMVAELAWRWTDFTTWITKSDAKEPSFSPLDFIGQIAPVPIVMIQSRRDEYVPEADYRKLDATARIPKKLVLIDAANHRFTDKQTELRAEMLAALAWIAEALPKTPR